MQTLRNDIMSTYFSQYKQDKFLDEVVFSKKRDGFYIDIGAHDGITISNSLFFEKYRNWKGVCVEPNPNVYKKLIENRKSTNLNVCIGSDSKRVKFTLIEGYSEMLSGITDGYDSRHVERIDREIKQRGGKKTELEVEMIKLNEIEGIKNKKIDFISIDTEGNESSILKSIDFSKINIATIVVENNYNDNEIRRFLKDKEYKFVLKLESDDVFIKKNLYTPQFKLKLFLWNVMNFFK